MALNRRHFLSLLAAPATVTETSRVDAKVADPKTLKLQSTERFPNSRLPVLVYQAVFPGGAGLADRFDALFEKHGWTGSWRNGLYSFHHYHSTAHEVLGVYEGSVRVRLGGERGTLVTLKAGDVAVLPAGTAHKNEEQSRDFRVLGAYPSGTSYDMMYGKPGERKRAEDNIGRVPVPPADPVLGRDAGLAKLWTKAGR